MSSEAVAVDGSYEKFPDIVVVNADYHILKRREHELWDYQVTNFSLGTPPTSFEAVLSLASTEILVPRGFAGFSSYCSGVCPNCTTYVSSASRTYRLGRKGGVHQETTDALIVAGGIQVPNQPFLQDSCYWHDEEESHPVYYFSRFGLAVGPPRDTHQDRPFRVGETQTHLSPFRNMIDSKVLKRNMFSLRLARSSTDEGHIMFGGYDHKQFEGDLVKHPWYMPETHLWSIEASSILMTTTNTKGLKDVLLNESVANLQVTLTTSPNIGFPEHFLSKILATVNTTMGRCLGGHCLDCDSELDRLPVLSILTGDQKFDIMPRDYIRKSTRPGKNEKECGVVFGRCYDMKGNRDEGQICLGSPFLDKLYTVFDWDTISFGKLSE